MNPIDHVSCPTSENEYVVYNREQSINNDSISGINIYRNPSDVDESSINVRQTSLLLLSTAMIPPEEILITQRKLLQLGESKRVIDNALLKCKEYISTSSHSSSAEYLMAMEHSDRVFGAIIGTCQNDISDESFSILSTLMSGNVSIELLCNLNESLSKNINVRRANECLLKAKKVLLESFSYKNEAIDCIFACYKKVHRRRIVNEKQYLKKLVQMSPISQKDVFCKSYDADGSSTNVRQTLLLLLSTALISPEEILITQRRLLQLGESKRVIDNAILKCKEHISTSSHSRSAEYLMAMEHSDRVFGTITCTCQNDISDEAFSILSTLMSGNVSI